MLQAQTNSKYQYFLPDSAALLSVLIRPCLHIPIPVHRGRTNKQVRSIYLCQLTPTPVPAAQQEFLFLPFPSQGCKTQATILPATLWSIFTNKICDCRNLEMLLERAHVVEVSCCPTRHPYCRLRNKPNSSPSSQVYPTPAGSTVTKVQSLLPPCRSLTGIMLGNG